MTEAQPLWRRTFAVFILSIGAISAWASLEYIWHAGPTIAWKRDGKDTSCSRRACSASRSSFRTSCG
jgi:hypothetical protein